MKHKAIRTTIKEGYGSSFGFDYYNTYENKTIEEVCKLKSIPYWNEYDMMSLSKAAIYEYKEANPNSRGYYGGAGIYADVSYYVSAKYDGVMCSDGFWFVPKNTTFNIPVPRKPKEIKTYESTEILAHDAVNQPIYINTIIHYSHKVGRYFEAGFYKVVSITDGKGSLIVREYSKKNDEFKSEDSRINQCGYSGIVIPNEVFENYRRNR